MERLIKDGDIILNGTLTRYEAEKQAFIRLGFIEELMNQNKIEDLGELQLALTFYHSWFVFLEKQIRKGLNKNAKTQD